LYRRNLSGPSEIRLRDDQTIGGGNLLQAFGIARQVQSCIHRIDRRDHVRKTKVMTHDRLRRQRVQDRRRIRESGGFDHDTVEVGYLRLIAAREQRAQSTAQVIPDAAADAAALEQHDRFVNALDQKVIEADLAELVDQHHGALHIRRAQQMLEQRRLTAAEKPGEDVDRDGGVG
jgi:hypothetical protein